jgi:very-short-patch-repair endonuclease
MKNFIMNELTERVRRLCQSQTEAEAIFWQFVRNKKMGYKFVRQKPLRFY